MLRTIELDNMEKKVEGFKDERTRQLSQNILKILRDMEAN